MTKKYPWNMLSALGGDIVEARPGYAKGYLPLTEEVMQPTRVFHAGAITTLADEVASTACVGEVLTGEVQKDLRFPYSVQISLNLLTNDPKGPLMAESKVVREGGLTVVDTVVTGADNQTVALMRSTHKMVNLNKSGPHLKRNAATESAT